MRKIFLLLFFSVITIFSFAQSVNDACAGSILVLTNGSCNNGNIQAADADNLTADAGCATTGNANQHKDVWYHFVAAGGGIAYNITGAAGTIEVNILSSTAACTGLGATASVCGAAPLTGSLGGLVPGTTYYVLVSRPSNATGTFTFCLTNIPAPANDLKCGAVALTPNGASVCATNYGATNTTDGTGSCFTTENGMWYSVTVATAPSQLNVSADFPSTNFDAQIAIFASSNNSCTGTFTELACDDNSGSGTNPLATTNITAAGTYFVLIDGFAGATGNFCIAATLETCSDGILNQNETGIDCGGVCPACAGGTGYVHPTTGQQNAYVGNCMVNTCSGNYYDDGNSGANYTNSVAAYRTFCPDSPGSCIRATFSAFNIEHVGYNAMTGALTGCYDYLWVLNGPTQTSAQFTGPASQAYDPAGAPAANTNFCGTNIPGPFTSTDPSGCLSFFFISDGTINRAGWTSSLTCVPCGTAAPTNGGPNGTDANDCTNAIQVCANTGLTGASTGPGISSDGCSGCNVSENFASWYKIVVTQSGTMGMVITPITGTNDYDFALYQASSCGNLGTPVRCTYAANTGTTGMVASATDNSEDVTGDGRVDTMRITAGDIYYLLVNKWDAGGSGFNINWGLSNGASIACPLPIELLNFDAEYNGTSVDLTWTTLTETNNDYFTVEKSLDGQYFKDIGKVDSKGINGNSSNILNYKHNDPDVKTGIYYYRLTQTDFDKQFKRSQIVVVNVLNEKDVFTVQPNPTSGAFDVMYYCYSDEKAVMKIFDEKGSLVKSEEVNCAKGDNKANVDLTENSNGLYVVVLTTRNKTYKTKIMKNN